MAPEHFVDESLSENVIAGNAIRTTSHLYVRESAGTIETGFVSTGLGAALSLGTTGFLLCQTLR